MTAAADPVEPDQTAAPFVLAYTAVVVAGLVGFLAWVFWFRGNP